MWSAIWAGILAMHMAAMPPLSTPVPTPVALSVNAILAAPDKPDRHVLLLLNQARAEQGLAPLAWDNNLARAAQHHAELLLHSREALHQFPGEAPLQERIVSTGLRVTRCGENLAINYDVERAHDALMHSPGHRANILDAKYDAVGIALIRDGGAVYVVQDFAERSSIVPNADAAHLLAARFAVMREQAGISMIHEVADERVQKWACSLAHSDQLSSATGVALPGARFALAFSTSDISNLPDLRPTNAVAGVDHYALGVCYSQTPRFPNGRYFVALAMFAPEPVTLHDQTNLPTAVADLGSGVSTADAANER